MTWVFQDGHLSSVLGFTSYGGVVGWQPLFMAVAVIIDATVVRAVLLPAALALLGARAWTLPGRHASRDRQPDPSASSTPAPEPRSGPEDPRWR